MLPFFSVTLLSTKSSHSQELPTNNQAHLKQHKDLLYFPKAEIELGARVFTHT